MIFAARSRASCVLPFDVIVHGCTGKGNDQFRIEYGLRLNAPGIPVYAPENRGDRWLFCEDAFGRKKRGKDQAKRGV